MRQPNGCSAPAPKSSAAKQWIKELAQTKEEQDTFIRTTIHSNMKGVHTIPFFYDRLTIKNDEMRNPLVYIQRSDYFRFS